MEYLIIGRRTFVLFGFDPSEGIPTLTQWLAALQPDGRDLLTDSLDRMFCEGVRGDVRYWVVWISGVLDKVR
jgi:hypothetical protein